jgi:GTP-binding protein Era
MSFRTGRVALVGRPNAGKSTLLNLLSGARLAATSEKPQTTRTRINGIVSTPTMQAVIVDTPGLHLPKSELNRRMVAAAERAMEGVDLVCWMVDATRPIDEELVARFTGQKGAPVIVALNKIDSVNPKQKLLPLIAAYAAVGTVVPISAKTGDGRVELLREWEARLPEGEAQFPEDQATDAPERAIAGELVREQIVRLLGQELPYVTAVEIERFDETLREAGQVEIAAKILVEKDSQKAIVLGAKGVMIRKIRKLAEHRIGELLGAKVLLTLFVAVEKDWTQNPRLLRELGYPSE